MLGDFDFSTGDVSDISNSNNGDISKILVTVLKIIIDFTNRNPDSKIVLQGNTSTKQKLYNRLVNNYLKELSSLISIKIIENEQILPYNYGKVSDQFYITKNEN